jgi:uncharacterized membrane protein
MFKKIFFIGVFLAFLLPTLSLAQENTLVVDTETFVKARVLEVISSGTKNVEGSGLNIPIQTLKIEVIEGPEAGRQVVFENDFNQLKKGDVFYGRNIQNTADGTDLWSVADLYRIPVLVFLTLLFVILIFVFGGIQGVRGLASLIGSFVLIFYLLVPQIYQGHDALMVSIGVSSLIIIVGSYITHGVNRTTSAAVIGMILTVLITGVLAYLSVHISGLSGYTSDESTLLSLDTKGSINMVGLLLGAIIIGLLGVLYDIAIGQAVSIEEILRAGDNLSKEYIYKTGIRIGREHIGALVNTLAIAYVGASLPLILLIQSSTAEFSFMINSEIFATEIIRILIGSIGLVLAVPITTYVAVRMLHGKVSKSSSSTHGHSHGHSHGHHHH